MERDAHVRNRISINKGAELKRTGDEEQVISPGCVVHRANTVCATDGGALGVRSSPHVNAK